jgi:hypothetical protein
MMTTSINVTPIPMKMSRLFFVAAEGAISLFESLSVLQQDKTGGNS